MKCVIVSIGDELLIGQTINTNAGWMGGELNKIGVMVDHVLTISDTKKAIKEALDQTISSCDVILITGGLGPTKDDITKKTLADYFDSKLVENKEALKNIERIFNAFNREVLPVNKLQALVPDKAEMLLNEKGTAPGMLFRKDGKIVVSMPGVPAEMKFLMSTYVLPIVKKEFDLPHILHKTILTQGIGESFIAEMIKSIEEELPEEVKLAYLPSPGRVKLRLTGIGNDKKTIEDKISYFKLKIENIVKDYVYGYDNEQLEEIVHQLLLDKRYSLSVAESCSGGSLAGAITSNPGSSKYFMGGVVAYSNTIKMNVLNVKESTLKDYGAVSEQTVKEMALGAQKLFNTDYAISTSGIAGPDGGTNEKPVGTVCIGIATPNEVLSYKFQMGEGRKRVVQKTVLSALKLLKDALTKEI